MTARVRVVIADDDPRVVTAVSEILATAPDVEVVGTAVDGREALDRVTHLHPDVALVDIRMPVLDGLAVADRLHGHDVAVVLLTTFNEQAYMDRAVDLGVAGFLLKSGDPVELVAGVRAAAAGGACLSPVIARQLMSDLRQTRTADESPSSDMGDLPPRSRELLVLLSEGSTNAEIASELFLTEGTVKAYLRDLFTRLGVRNRVEAAAVAHRSGLVRYRDGR